MKTKTLAGIVAASVMGIVTSSIMVTGCSEDSKSSPDSVILPIKNITDSSPVKLDLNCTDENVRKNLRHERNDVEQVAYEKGDLFSKYVFLSHDKRGAVTFKTYEMMENFGLGLKKWGEKNYEDLFKQYFTTHPRDNKYKSTVAFVNDLTAGKQGFVNVLYLIDNPCTERSDDVETLYLEIHLPKKVSFHIQVK